MNKFKVGDWVECIDNLDLENSLTVGNEYKIRSIDTVDGSFLFEGDFGSVVWANKVRFKKKYQTKQELAKQFLAEVEKLSKEYGLCLSIEAINYYELEVREYSEERIKWLLDAYVEINEEE